MLAFSTTSLIQTAGHKMAFIDEYVINISNCNGWFTICIHDFFSLSLSNEVWMSVWTCCCTGCMLYKTIPPNDVLGKKRKKAELFSTSDTSGANLFLFYTGEEQTNKEELKSEAKGYFFCKKVDRPANLTNMQMIILARFLNVFGASVCLCFISLFHVQHEPLSLFVPRSWKI